MRLAVFDHILNNGGGKRFLLNLLCSLLDIAPEIKITLFCNKDKGDKAFFQSLEEEGVVVKQLESLRISAPSSNIFRRSFQYLFKKVVPLATNHMNIQEALKKEISQLTRYYDVAYFPWPFLLEAPTTFCPKVATFHDFNFRYFFGTYVFSSDQAQFLDRSIKEWLKDTVPVVSTLFMQSELKRFYPEIKDAFVAHLSSLNIYNQNSSKLDDYIWFEHLMDKPYIVFPVHLTSHKNIGTVIAAASLVNKDAMKFRLVLTGGSTETIIGRSAYYGLEQGESQDADVYGLGYISDYQMHQLLKNAFAVINASPYEAGNGVGLDAWPMGVPVLQSNIPAFEEHLGLQGFKAFTFDPRNTHSIAAAIMECIEDKDKRKSLISDSLNAAQGLDWHVTARSYLNIFQQTIDNYRNEN